MKKPWKEGFPAPMLWEMQKPIFNFARNEYWSKNNRSHGAGRPNFQSLYNQNFRLNKPLHSISHYIIPHATWSKLTHQPNNILKLFMALYERAIPTTLEGMSFKINFKKCWVWKCLLTVHCFSTYLHVYLRYMVVNLERKLGRPAPWERSFFDQYSFLAKLRILP